MGIRKKLLPFVMAAVLAFTTAGTGFAEEVLVETEEESGAGEAVVPEDSLEEESDITAAQEDLQDGGADIAVAQEDLQEGGSDISAMQDYPPENESGIDALQDEETQIGIDGEDTFSLEEGISVEEIQVVETKDYMINDEVYILDEEITDSVEKSGYASYAAPSMMRTFSATQYTDSFGAQLNEESKCIYDALVSAFVIQRSSEDISIALSHSYTFHTDGTLEDGKLIWDKDNNEEFQGVKDEIRSAVQAAYDAFVYDYPEVFWISEFIYKYSISYSYNNKTNIYTGKIESITTAIDELYAGAKNEIGAFYQAVNAAKNEIDFGMPELVSKVETVKAIHDYLCNKLVYSENTYAHSAAGVFLHGQSVVCEGYAKAFKILCRQYGIESVLVVGGAWSPSKQTYEAHMWNYVKMEDNKWYLVDATWDDRKDGISSKYFLVGSESIGFYSKTLSEERVIYSNFSGSLYTQNFEVPVLSDSAYELSTTGEENPHIHEWTVASSKKATCDENGYYNYSCKTCGKVLQRVLAATGHTWQIISNSVPTCVQAGKKVYQCSNCNDTKTEVIPATGHRYTNYVSDGNASWNIDGTKTAVCANGCGTKDTVVDSGSAKIPTIALSASSLVLQVGQSTTALKVTSMTAGDKVTSWKSSNTKIVKVNSGTGKITAQKKTGSAKITVTLSSGLKKSITVKVQKAPVKTTKISGLDKTVTLKIGAKKTLKPKLYPITSKEKITYTSSNKKVATVSSKGVITAKAAGTARITVKSGTKKIVVTVKVPKITATKITNIPAAVTIKVKKTKILKPKLYPAGSSSKITYSSSKKSVAVVSSSGKITAKKKGKTVITVKAGKAVMKCTVTVK